MITWIKGFFEAGKPQSSKRLMGIVSGLALILVCMLDLFNAIIVHEWVGYVLAGYSAAALGFSSIPVPTSKKKTVEKE